MKPTELRIGNLVNVSGVKTKVTPNLLMQSEKFFEREVTPIELTEKNIVHECGFRKWNLRKGGNVYSKGTIILHKRIRGFVIAKRYTEPKYIHQIQNIYFELMNQNELITS